jgi:hypothetical protein
MKQEIKDFLKRAEICNADYLKVYESLAAAYRLEKNPRRLLWGISEASILADAANRCSARIHKLLNYHLKGWWIDNPDNEYGRLDAAERRAALKAIREAFPWEEVRGLLIEAGIIKQRRPRSAARRRKRAR